eukprot:TRINITY_DN5624_c0_g1_i1.p1 TRINITY_DN5624_c0_g1~~TRINITY_DN5624_c0_g1_i1.p1  ORF type:complete len:795 (+),score=299.89 TRINITY_DN5624_c0_g1_i1:63-2387(+)
MVRARWTDEQCRAARDKVQAALQKWQRLHAAGRALPDCSEADCFVDLEFLPQSAQLHNPEENGLVWLRPVDFAPGEAQKLFIADKGEADDDPEKAIEPGDIDQHMLGDCWLLACIAGIAEFPLLVLSIFDAPYAEHPDPKAQRDRELRSGGMQLQLNKHGWWRTVTVDTFLPCMGGEPAYTYNVEQPGELWAALIEKAYAKMHGSYGRLVGGNAAEAYPDLTGFPAQGFQMWKKCEGRPVIATADLVLSDQTKIQKDKTRGKLQRDRVASSWQVVIDGIQRPLPFNSGWFRPSPPYNPLHDDELFRKLWEADQKDFLMALSTPSRDMSGAAKNHDQHSEGLSFGHQYTLITVLMVHKDTGEVLQRGSPQAERPGPDVLRLCKIRNPWGNDVEWSGAWSDGDERWEQHPAVKKACQFEACDDGIFWMEWTDVQRRFSEAVICYAQPTWNEVRLRCSFSYGTPSSCVEVRLDRETEFWVTVSQHDHRAPEPGSAPLPAAPHYEALLVTLLSWDDAAGLWVLKRSSHKGVYYASRDVTLRGKLPAGRHIIFPKRSTANWDSSGGPEDKAPRELRYVLCCLTPKGDCSMRFISPSQQLLQQLGRSPRLSFVDKEGNLKARDEFGTALDACQPAAAEVQVNRTDKGRLERVELKADDAAMEGAGLKMKHKTFRVADEALRRRRQEGDKGKREQARAKKKKAKEAYRQVFGGAGGHADPFRSVEETENSMAAMFLTSADRDEYLRIKEQVRAELLKYKREFFAGRGVAIRDESVGLPPRQ